MHAAPSRMAWLFPGIGARFVGMGGDLQGRSAVADELAEQASRWLGYDVWEACLGGSGRKHVPARQESQLIYIVDCAYAATLAEMGWEPRVVCGHSLGTWAAAQAAGVFDFLTGLQLLTRVEQLLEELVPTGSQTLGVVLGLPEQRVVAICSQEQDVSIANRNSPLQFVIGGPLAGLERTLVRAKEAGAHKVKLLPFPRAMHTPLVRSATERWERELAQTPLADPHVPLVSGHDGAWLETAGDVGRHLAEFLHLPVCWEKAMRGLRERFLREFLEVGPGSVLTDLMGYIDRETVRKTASDVLYEVQPA